MVTDTACPPARPPATNTQTHRHDQLQYTVPLASAQCNQQVNIYQTHNNIQSIFNKRRYTMKTRKILELCKSKCLPLLLYGLECCNFRSADLHSLDFTYNRLFMKLFRTKSIDLVKGCQYFFGAVLPSVLLRKADKLALRYQCLENAFCTYCRSI